MSCRVALRDVPPGSAWRDLDEFAEVGVRWPEPDEQGRDCSYTGVSLWSHAALVGLGGTYGDAYEHDPDREVDLLVEGLTREQCDHVAAPEFDDAERARRVVEIATPPAPKPCLLFARPPDDGGVRWTREQLDWIDAAGIDDRTGGDADERADRARVLAAIVGVVVDQTWGAAVVDGEPPGHEYVLAVSWDREPYASLDPDELELLAARWLHEEGWRPEHGSDAALQAIGRAEQRWAREQGCAGGDPRCFYASREEHDAICDMCTAKIDRKLETKT